MEVREDALSAWKQHLDTQLELARPGGPREGDFDMDDEAELARIAGFPRLNEALQYLQTNLFPVWKKIDANAILFQRTHRLLARIVIITGTLAIILAVFQMALTRSVKEQDTHKTSPPAHEVAPPHAATSGSPPELTAGEPTAGLGKNESAKLETNEESLLGKLAVVLEGFAVVAGTIAVLIGLRTKRDRKWLGERNRAQRLRLLKFSALGWDELFCEDLTSWKQRLEREVAGLAAPISEKDLREWSEVEFSAAKSVACGAATKDASLPAAVRTYYGIKRLEFQERYFKDRAHRLHAEAHHLRHLSLPIFVISTACVLIHFLAEGLQHSNSAPWVRWDIVGVWSLTLGIIIPIAGLGARVWLGAFEPHRSANLYACKHRTVEDLRKRMDHLKNEPQAWTAYVAEVELFFENEHREWLRLMLETEWML